VRCPAGRLAIELEPVADGVRAWIATPREPFGPSPLPVAQLLALLGGDERMLARDLPIQRTGRKLYVPFARRADLWSLAPRFEALAAAGREHGITGVYAFTRDTLETGSVTHGRFFAPAVGIREDPVTGAASGPLAEYLADAGILARPARARAEQGDAIGKPGRVDLEITDAGPRVGGVAVTVMEARLLR
jgi:PhzF family phenazine biosynthesis protein